MFKVQIGVRLQPLQNYLNVELAYQNNEQDRVAGDIFKLDSLIDNNESDEIIINDSLDFIPLQARATALQHVLSKVAHGGKIVITGNDIEEVCRLGHLGQLQPDQLNSIIYGIGKKSAVRPVDNIQMVLQTGQFDLEELKYNTNIPFQYVLTLLRK